MYLVIIGAVAVAVLAVLVAGVYRVLKSAHARPQGTDAPHSHDAAPHSRTGTSQSHSGLERAVLFVVSRMLRLGLRLGPTMLLTVRGRTTGVARTNPVDLFERDGRHWLVATHQANASWVRNLRAAGQGTLTRGRRRYAFTAIELPRAEAGTVLKEVVGPRLARPIAGFVLRQTLGVAPDAPLEEFIAAAAARPVFELAVSRDSNWSAPAHPRPAPPARR